MPRKQRPLSREARQFLKRVGELIREWPAADDQGDITDGRIVVLKFKWAMLGHIAMAARELGLPAEFESFRANVDAWEKLNGNRQRTKT